MRSSLNLMPATLDQVDAIVGLVNLAYRGDHGWTRETDIVCGQRTTRREVEALLLAEDAHLLVADFGGTVAACICIERAGRDAHIGLFAVAPALQGRGLGKQVLAMAERYARENLGAERFIMVVVSQRTELIAYYERRGYVRTGRVERYPVHLNVGVPKSDGLTVEHLEKPAGSMGSGSMGSDTIDPMVFNGV